MNTQPPPPPADSIAAPPLLAAIAADAYAQKASDVHLSPGEPPWFRRGHTFGTAAGAFRQPLTVDVLRTFLNWAGGTDVSVTRIVGGVRWRVTAYHAVDGDHIKLRIIPDLPPPFEKLGLPEEVRALSTRTDGLIITAGGTGSGKTTTLASLIALIVRSRQVHLHTIEEPVEYRFEPLAALVTQRELGPDLASKTALTTAMRSDIDVVLFGEIRDAEDIEMSMQLALSGHLVLSTIHARDSASVCERIAPNARGRSILAQVLRAIIVQKLLPDKNDPTQRHLAAEILLVDHIYRQLIRTGNLSRIEANLFQDKRSMDVSLANLVHAGKVRDKDAAAQALNDELYQLAYTRKRSPAAR